MIGKSNITLCQELDAFKIVSIENFKNLIFPLPDGVVNI